MHLSGDPEPGDVCGLFFFFSVAPNSVGSEGLRCYGFAVASESASCLHKNPGPLSPAMNTVPLEADAVLYMLVLVLSKASAPELFPWSLSQAFVLPACPALDMQISFQGL